MMRKTILACFILALVLAAGGCSKSLEAEPVEIPTPTVIITHNIVTPVPTPSPVPKPQENADIEYAVTSIDDEIITLDLPQNFVINENQTGQIFSAEGYLSPETESNYYTFEVLRFYKVEDVTTSIQQLLEFDETIETYHYSSDIEYTNLMKNVFFGDAMGHLSKIGIGDDTKYTSTLYAGDTFYKFILYAKGGFDADEIAYRILTSIDIDGDKASAKAETVQFPVDEDGVYSSLKLEGASVVCPEGWFPAESMYFSLDESVLSLMSMDMSATAVVKYYPKELYPNIPNYESFNAYMLEDLIHRGFVDEQVAGNVQLFDDDSERGFYMYPTDLVLIHFTLEYESAYYCIELMHNGTESELVAQMLEIGQTFQGVGEEIVD